METHREYTEQYHKVIFNLFHCSQKEQPKTSQETVSERETSAPLIKNVLGDNLYSSLHDFFSSQESEDQSQVERETYRVRMREKLDHECNFIKSYDFVFTESDLYLLVVAVVIILSLICIVCGFAKYRRKLQCKIDTSLHKHLATSEPSVSKVVDLPTVNKSPEKQTHSVEKVEKKSIKDSFTKISLSYQLKLLTVSATRSHFDFTIFLSNISETLFSKLDMLLLKDPVVDQTRSHATIATPRLARRPLNNRQRIGSSPSLALASTSTTVESHTSYIERKQAWDIFKAFSKQMNWKQSNYIQFEDSKLDRQNQRLVHFYQRVCPIKSDHWKATAFLVNFALFLLQAEKDTLICQNGYHFLEFLPTGSGKMGTMVGRPNQFDVLMVLQPEISPTDAIIDDSHDTLPPGCFFINADLTESSSIATRETSSYVTIGHNKLLCLSSKEFSRSAEELIDMSIQSLYTKTRSLMDRLPFRIRKYPSANLSVMIDTRSLVGLSLPELRINIIPVLPLKINGWFQTDLTYAMPVYETDRLEPPSSDTNRDYMWQVNCDLLNTVFMQGFQSKMSHAGIDSCHEVCLMILKTLFTGKDKNSLLDKGVVQSFVLSNALNFLLLESSPEQWTVCSLRDRFSDLVHFLRAAFRNGRLPHFFISNPHLNSKMPAVDTNQLLSRRRQQNLLADLKQHRLNKCLDFIESSINDAGLVECLKGDYSEDMWEYEFFLFN